MAEEQGKPWEQSGSLSEHTANAKFGDIFEFMHALRANTTSDINDRRLENLLRIFEKAAVIAGKEYNVEVPGHAEYPSAEDFLSELNHFGGLTGLAKWQNAAELRDSHHATLPATNEHVIGRKKVNLNQESAPTFTVTRKKVDLE